MPTIADKGGSAKRGDWDSNFLDRLILNSKTEQNYAKKFQICILGLTFVMHIICKSETHESPSKICVKKCFCLNP